MPDLIITSATPDGWVTREANTGLQWTIEGGSPFEQFLNLQDFAQFMERGDMIGACTHLVGAGEGAQLADIAELVFSTDGIMFEGTAIFAAAEEGAATLIEAIVVAGERLAEAVIGLG
jgi:hypothetical protein